MKDFAPDENQLLRSIGGYGQVSEGTVSAIRQRIKDIETSRGDGVYGCMFGRFEVRQDNELGTIIIVGSEDGGGLVLMDQQARVSFGDII